ncbi:hypothetical protein DOY81_010135, partial [Sarcophaga bullata]
MKFFLSLDLAFQLPRKKPRKYIPRPWHGLEIVQESLFSGDFIGSAGPMSTKEQFTELVKNLKKSFNENDLLLRYFNAPALNNHIDFVNLAAFDFTTPDRNPFEADYTAPLYAPTIEGNRMPHYNVDYQVEHWTSQRFPKTKLNVGIATYGRAWKMTLDSKDEGYPVVESTKGPAEVATQTKIS